MKPVFATKEYDADLCVVGGILPRANTTDCFDELRSENLDPDYSRLSVSPNKKMQVFAQALNRDLDFAYVKTPATIVRSFRVLSDGNEIYATGCSYRSFLRIPLSVTAKEIAVEFSETRGADEVRLFSCDLASP